MNIVAVLVRIFDDNLGLVNAATIVIGLERALNFCSSLVCTATIVIDLERARVFPARRARFPVTSRAALNVLRAFLIFTLVGCGPTIVMVAELVRNLLFRRVGVTDTVTVLDNDLVIFC